MASLLGRHFGSRLRNFSSLIIIKKIQKKHRVDFKFMSRQRDKKGIFIKNPPKIGVIGTSLFDKKGFISTVDTFKMAEEETSKGPTAKHRREYERRLEMENKLIQERREEARRHDRE